MAAPTLRAGIVRDYDGGSHTATVQLDDSLLLSMLEVPVAANIDGAGVTADRRALVIVFDSIRPADAIVVAVWDA